MIIPECLKEQILQGVHNQMGHQGVERTLELTRKRCNGPEMHKDITTYVKKHECCILAKLPLPKVKTASGNLLASRPLEGLAIDFTVLEQASDGHENTLVMTDIFTKFTLVVVTLESISGSNRG